MDTSPRFTIATSSPASSGSPMTSAAAQYPAARTLLSLDIPKSKGMIFFPSRRTAPEAILSASIPPEDTLGAAITGHASSATTALRVSSAGSPGPTPTA